MPGRTPEGDALTNLVMPVFELAAALDNAASSITEGSQITPAMWQVLGLLIDEPLTVAVIARRLGRARQSVQRLANVAVETGIAEWRENPEHKRSQLLALTSHGYAELAALRPRQHKWANAVAVKLGEQDLLHLSQLVKELTEAIRDEAD
ncbi:MarR family winged helix-turn-helix transcriptional regulator [Corynebacterium glaucum]|uniref:MarR family winged helix-turn-helix transcriptional regulator n=1 Tax=Corynebacterium glaucum TaxID=187491 RepID=UPI00265A0554|nr:helix-turn-helix domain-containing protein [Corynebacterium glaucum]